MSTKSQLKLAKTIKRLRESKNLSQGQLALAAGIDRKTINRIERGHYSPSMDTFIRICTALSAKPTELVNGKA